MTQNKIRPINAASEFEVDLVASRMRQTLIEVLGQEKGTALYSLDWLKQRVLFHLDSEKSTGQVFVSENQNGVLTGHFIARIERDDSGKEIGFGSTIYVDPEFRKQGIATKLLFVGESWMLKHSVTEAVYYTADTNSKLIDLFCSQGYEITERRSEMVKLRKCLRQAPESLT